MKNLPEETVNSMAEIIAHKNDAIPATPLLTKLPTCLFLVSLVVYLLSSEGIRNYLLFLHKTLMRMMEYVK